MFILTPSYVFQSFKRAELKYPSLLQPSAEREETADDENQSPFFYRTVEANWSVHTLIPALLSAVSSAAVTTTHGLQKTDGWWAAAPTGLQTQDRALELHYYQEDWFLLPDFSGGISYTAACEHGKGQTGKSCGNTWWCWWCPHPWFRSPPNREHEAQTGRRTQGNMSEVVKEEEGYWSVCGRWKLSGRWAS